MSILRKLYQGIPKSIRYRTEPLAIKSRRIKNSFLFKFKHLKKFPEIIQIETNSLCNGTCLFCPYVSVRTKKENKKMSVDNFKKVMSECSSYSVNIIYLCVMNEPLTDERIVDFINYAKEKNPRSKIKIITNAYLLSEKLSMELIKSRLDEISFSIHGWTKDTYRNVMGTDVNRVLQNVTSFLKLNTRRDLKANIVCVGTKYFTKQDYYIGYDFCKKYNIEFGLSYLSNMADNLDPALRNKLGIRKIRHIKLRGCMDGWPLTSMHILHDSEVVACCLDWRREISLGNISRETLYDIWNSQVYRDFRDKIYKGKYSDRDFLCKRCSEAI